MRLGIDGKRLVQARTGPARWLEQLLLHWRAVTGPFAEMRCYTPGLTSNDWALPPKLQHIVLPTRLPMFVWENWTLARAARADDVLFGASYTIPLRFPGRTVVSIQGIYEGPHAEPAPWWHRYRYSVMYRSSAHRADVVLANSQSTKNDLVEYYGTDPAKIHVVYQGVGPPFGWREDRDTARAEAARVNGGDGPFILFVGKLSPRRNVPLLLDAFRDALPRLPSGTRLLLVGPDHVHLDIGARIAERGVASVVRHIPHLDQESLAALYSAAVAFVLPTTHEGLSATILEAMACGTPVITVGHATLREGFAEHCLVLPAADRDLMRDALVRISNDSALRERLRIGGIGVAASRTWQRTADETMSWLWRVASQ